LIASRVSHHRLRIGAFLALSIVAFALIGGIGVILRTFAAEQAQRAQAERASEVIVLLRDVTRDAVAAESAQRGYFITLDREYLEPYEVARERYHGALERLRGFAETSGDPRQPELVAEIAALSEAKFAEMAASVGLIRAAQLNEARRRILSDQGQHTMERLRLAVDRFARIEQEYLDRARARAIDAEERIVPLLVGLLLLILIALGLALNLALRNAEAEARAAQAAELAEARDRADLLAGELNHRVKNLFAVVLAIIRMSGRDDPEAKPVAERIAARVTALLRAHELTQGKGGEQQVALVRLVETVLAPYRSEGVAAEVDGPAVDLSPREATPVGLILHELATNCVKYGAWSAPGGRLEVTWQNAESGARLELRWREHCAEAQAAPSDSRGFGSTLLDGSIRQLSGKIERSFHADGIEVRISLPLASEA
jgi:two-component sensor histidine kinase/CHASE3 domain sensor protein